MIDILRNNLKLDDISYKRADWANFRECYDIVKGGEVIWKSSPYDAATTAYLKATYPAYWNEIRAFGISHPNLVPFVNTTPDIIIWLLEYPTFGDLVLTHNLTFETPIIAVDAQNDSERMWLIRSGAKYTNWNSLDNIMSQTDWDYKLGGFSSNGGTSYCTKAGTTITAPRTLVRFFRPTEMPTGYIGKDADNVMIYVNGTQIFSGTHRSVATVPYDFSNIIQLNRMNFVAIAWTGSGTHGEDFGFY